MVAENGNDQRNKPTRQKPTRRAKRNEDPTQEERGLLARSLGRLPPPPEGHQNEEEENTNEQGEKETKRPKSGLPTSTARSGLKADEARQEARKPEAGTRRSQSSRLATEPNGPKSGNQRAPRGADQSRRGPTGREEPEPRSKRTHWVPLVVALEKK